MSKTVRVIFDDVCLEKLKYLSILKNTNVNSLILEAIVKLLTCNCDNVEPVKVDHGVGRNIKMPDELLERLDKFAEDHKMNRSEAVRFAVTLFLKENNIDNVTVSGAKVVKIKLY